MNSWSMKKDRKLIQLARAKLTVDQIATRLEVAPTGVLKVAKRLGIKLMPNAPKPDRRLKAKSK